MKKIIIFTVVFITLATSIFVVSCKKENYTDKTKNTNNEYMSTPEFAFFYSNYDNKKVINNSKAKVTLKCECKGDVLDREFDTWDDACEWAKKCNATYPLSYTNWTIDDKSINCSCFNNCAK